MEPLRWVISFHELCYHINNGWDSPHFLRKNKKRICERYRKDHTWALEDFFIYDLQAPIEKACKTAPKKMIIEKPRIWKFLIYQESSCSPSKHD